MRRIHCVHALLSATLLLTVSCSSKDPSDLSGAASDELMRGKRKAVVQTDARIRYVPMPEPAAPLDVLLTVEGETWAQPILRDIGGDMRRFIEKMSRGKVNLNVATGEFQSGGPVTPTNKILRFIPGAGSHVPIIGNSATARHELGHEFSFNHSHTRLWDTQTTIKQESNRDPFDPMNNSPLKPSFNAPHLHYVGWFGSTEEAYAEPGREYILSVLNDDRSDSESLKSIYYEVPGTQVRRLWFSYVTLRDRENGWQAPDGMPETAVVVHEASGARVQAGQTYMEGLVGLEPKTNVRSGLILHLSEATPDTVKVRITMDPRWRLELDNEPEEPNE